LKGGGRHITMRSCRGRGGRQGVKGSATCIYPVAISPPRGAAGAGARGGGVFLTPTHLSRGRTCPLHTMIVAPPRASGPSPISGRFATDRDAGRGAEDHQFSLGKRCRGVGGKKGPLPVRFRWQTLGGVQPRCGCDRLGRADRALTFTPETRVQCRGRVTTLPVPFSRPLDHPVG